MTLYMNEDLLQTIRGHGETNYPNEGAGLVLGRERDNVRQVIVVMPLENRATRRRRYLLNPQDMLAAEMEAERLGLGILGIFHSHPDIPAEPSQNDLQTAFHWFSYVITSVQAGKALETRSWRLHQDRSGWSEERIEIQVLKAPA